MHNQAAFCEQISRGSRIFFATRDVCPSWDSDASEQNYRGRSFSSDTPTLSTTAAATAVAATVENSFAPTSRD